MSAIIDVATNVFQTIKPESHVIVDYDKAEDVLYVNFTNSPVQEADFGRRFGDYIVRIKQGLVIGVTILNARSHYQKKFSDKPPILTAPITVKFAIA